MLRRNTALALGHAEEEFHSDEASLYFSPSTTAQALECLIARASPARDTPPSTHELPTPNSQLLTPEFPLAAPERRSPIIPNFHQPKLSAHPPLAIQS
jgi:hypothetical protein